MLKHWSLAVFILIFVPVVSLAAPATSITGVMENGGRLDWSARLNQIAFDRRESDGYFDIYTMAPNGMNMKCLTCDKPALPNKSIGNPAWHPSGDYIVFQAQNSYKGLGDITDYFANPGAGINNDIWIMDREGKRFWQMTKVPVRKGGVLHPHFSANGKKLLWSERIDSAGGSMGTWVLRLADFSVDKLGVPRLRNVRTLQPGVQTGWYESHGFSPNGLQIIFSGNLEPGQKPDGMDIYVYNLLSGQLKNLTQSMKEWDEHALFSPDGKSIIWMTNKGHPKNLVNGQPATDYWIMNADGSNKRQLTSFNFPGSPEYIKGGVTAADFSWSPDGSRFAGYLITDVTKGGINVIVTLNP